MMRNFFLVKKVGKTWGKPGENPGKTRGKPGENPGKPRENWGKPGKTVENQKQTLKLQCLKVLG